MFQKFRNLFGITERHAQSDSPEYFEGTDEAPHIRAGLADGSIVPWRVDSTTGKQWYRRVRGTGDDASLVRGVES